MLTFIVIDKFSQNLLNIEFYGTLTVLPWDDIIL